MSRRHLVAGAAVAALLVGAPPAAAQAVDARGMANLVIRGREPRREERAQAVRAAEINAIERYVAETNPARSALFAQSKDQILADIGQILLSSVVVSEEVNRDTRTLTIVVRVEINRSILEGLLQKFTPSPVAGQDVAVLFMARSVQSERAFDDAVQQRSVETRDRARTDSAQARGAAEQRARSAQTGSQEDAEEAALSVSRTGDDPVNTTGQGAQSSLRTSARQGERSNTAEAEESRETASRSTTTRTNTFESDGSVTRQANVYRYTVSPSQDINQTMTGVFARSSINLVEAEFIDGLDLDGVRADFGGGDDLRPETLRALVFSVRQAGLQMLALGTMTMGLPDRDPATGNQRVFVTVNARLYDLSRQFPRVLTSVGPVQFSGLGPTVPVAQTNALKIASDQAARRLVDELSARRAQ